MAGFELGCVLTWRFWKGEVIKPLRGWGGGGGEDESVAGMFG